MKGNHFVKCSLKVCTLVERAHNSLGAAYDSLARRLRLSARAICGASRGIALAVSLGVAPWLAGPATSAEVMTVFSKTGGPAMLVLVGEIVQGDSQKLASELIDVFGRGHAVGGVHLYSPGGNAYEGLLLARLIRDFHLTTYAPQGDEGNFSCFGEGSRKLSGLLVKNCVCASACGMAWLGGVIRRGTPGFHRVYYRDSGQKFGDVRVGVAEILEQLSVFLDEIQTPSWLRDIILSTGRSDMYYLDERDRRELLVDPTFRDYADGTCDNLRPDRDAVRSCIDNVRVRVANEAFATMMVRLMNQPAQGGAPD